MTREEQIQFVKSLSETVINGIITQIESGKIPEEWRGVELRELLSIAFENQTRFMNGTERREFQKQLVNIDY